MNSATFWDIIRESGVAARTGKYADQVPDTRLIGRFWPSQCYELGRILSDCEESEVASFVFLFDQFWDDVDTYELWGAAFLICGGCSEDGFMDFCSWVSSGTPSTMLFRARTLAGICSWCASYSLPSRTIPSQVSATCCAVWNKYHCRE